MKWLGKKLNKSPMVLEATLKAQFAQMGEGALYLTDSLLDAAGVVERPDTKGLKRDYLERYVTSSIDDGSTASISDFYDKMKELEVKALDDPQSALLLKSFKKANDDMRDLRKVRDGMLYDRLLQPGGMKFSKEEKKRKVKLISLIKRYAIPQG